MTADSVSNSFRRRIGYSMWGFLGAGVLDTPDGSRAYRRAFVDALATLGAEMVFLQRDRDRLEAGLDLRGSYCWDDGLPPLDALILEWRWPLHGRNTTACETDGHTCDLHRQAELMDHYPAAGVRTLVWDLDRQLPLADPVRHQPNVTVGEYALHRHPASAFVPCPVPDAAIDAADPQRLAARPRPLHLVYVGNQYDRDQHFDRYFAPAAAVLTHQVAGKWTRTEQWPGLNFTGRAAFGDVAPLHHSSLATVLLMPDRYCAVGHMTSRWGEAVTAGCLPLLPSDVAGGEHYVPDALVVDDGADVVDRVRWLASIAGTDQHAQLIQTCLDLLEPFRCSRVAAHTLTLLEAQP